VITYQAAVGVSSNASPVKAALATDDGNQDDDQDHKVADTKDPNVASVMDAQGAPISESAADAIEENENSAETNSVLPASAVRSITQASATAGVSKAQQDAFLKNIGPIAQQAASKYNVYASVMMAQAIIESSWGQSTLSTQSNN